MSNLAIGGVAVDPNGTYRVTVNSFLADGGDNYPVLIQGTDRLGGDFDLDAVAATLIVSPTSGVAGTIVQVVGAGFPASSPVALCWDNSGCSDLGIALPGPDDTFSAIVIVPLGALAGGHQIVACRQGSQPCATASFTVLPNPTTTTSTVTTVTTTTTVPTTVTTVVTTTTLFTNTTSTTAGVSPSTTAPVTPTTGSVATTSTIPTVGPIGATMPPTPPEGDRDDAPPTTATSASGGDQGPATAGAPGEGDLLVTASEQAGNESFVDRLRFWLGGIQSESAPSIPTTVAPSSEVMAMPPSEEAASPASQPVSGLPSLPLWSQVAALSAGVAALFFVIPLIARWVWNLSHDE